jgi:hypothetical protein
VPPDQPIAEPDDNVPVNVHTADDTVMIHGQYTDLVVILDEPVPALLSPQVLEIESHYTGATSTDTANDVWQNPPDGLYLMYQGEQIWTMRVRVKANYDRHGIMRLSACTRDGTTCPSGETKYAAIEINP